MTPPNLLCVIPFSVLRSHLFYSRVYASNLSRKFHRLHYCLLNSTLMHPTHCLPRSPNLKCRSLQLIEVCAFTRRRRRRRRDPTGLPSQFSSVASVSFFASVTEIHNIDRPATKKTAQNELPAPTLPKMWHILQRQFTKTHKIHKKYKPAKPQHA